MRGAKHEHRLWPQWANKSYSSFYASFRLSTAPVDAFSTNRCFFRCIPRSQKHKAEEQKHSWGTRKNCRDRHTPFPLLRVSRVWRWCTCRAGYSCVYYGVCMYTYVTYTVRGCIYVCCAQLRTYTPRITTAVLQLGSIPCSVGFVRGGEIYLVC